MKTLRLTLASIAGSLLVLSTTSLFADTTVDKTTATAASSTTKPVAAPKVVVPPNDAKVIALARKNGAKMTTRGLVQPKTVLKKETSPINVPVTLSESEKEVPVGKAEKTTKTRGGGSAFIFIKPDNLKGLGHIGWGYWAPNQNYFVGGSTENNPGWPTIKAGNDNGYWSEAFWDEASMFTKFKSMGYYAYKKKSVSSIKQDLAWARACYTRDNGFRGVSWNCLDHTYYILEGYGVTGMPWTQTNPVPNGWFNAFPGTGYRLP